MSNQTAERADLRKWRERRQCESAARKPANRKKYTRTDKSWKKES